MSTPQFIPAGTATKLPVFGVEVEILLDGTATNGVSALYRVTAAPGAGAPPHRHAGQDELFQVNKGTFDVMCDGQVHRLKAGDVAFAPRGSSHAFTAVDEPGEILVMSTPSGHEAFFRDCAAAVANGTFGPATGRDICERHGVELLV